MLATRGGEPATWCQGQGISPPATGAAGGIAWVAGPARRGSQLPIDTEVA